MIVTRAASKPDGNEGKESEVFISPIKDLIVLL